MSKQSEHIDHLIARYISGEASETEKQELRLWMDENEANRKYFDGIRFVDDKAVASHQRIKVDVEKAWKDVHMQMKSSRKINSSKVPIRVMPLWLRVAAVVVLISGLSLVFYNQLSNHALPKYEASVVAPADSIINYVLADSSVVTLNHNSKIAQAADYGKTERRVKLTGEAFFSVQHNAGKPFIVESNGTFIRVTGTSFNVKGEDSDSLVEVYVKTGSVLFFTESNEGLTLIAGESGIYNRNKGTFIKAVVSDPNLTAYVNRVFVFYDTSLNEVFRQLKRVYGVNISVDDPKLGLCTITVSFNDDNIETILDIIAETLNLKYTVNNKQQYVFEGPLCNVEE